MDAQAVFSGFYARDAWNGGSGPGSAREFCEPLVSFLRGLVIDEGIGSICDIGCGDLQWMPDVAGIPGMEYTGIDVVPAVIAANRERFRWGRFIRADLTRDLDWYPRADLYWMKDVLQHWPDEIVVDWLDRFFAVHPLARLLVCNCSHQTTTPRALDRKWHFAPLSGSLPPLRDYAPEVLFEWSGKTVYRLHARSPSLRPEMSDVPAA
jgi:hypothetical protein